MQNMKCSFLFLLAADWLVIVRPICLNSSTDIAAVYEQAISFLCYDKRKHFHRICKTNKIKKETGAKATDEAESEFKATKHNRWKL